MSRRVKYGKLFVLAAFSILISMALTCSMSISDYYVHDETLSEFNRLARVLTYFSRSFSNDRVLTLALSLIAGLLLFHLPKLHSTPREKILAGIFSTLFSTMQLIGRSYAENNSWDAIFGSRFVVLRSGIILAGTMLFVWCLMLYVFRLLDYLSLAESDQPGTFSKKRFLLSGTFIFVCWLPYFLCFFPGTSNYDTGMQIAMFFHRPQWLTALSAVRGDNIYITNHHPYFTTVLFGSFAQIGVWLGNVAYGIALYCLLQMALTAFVFAGAAYYVRWLGLSERWRKALVLFSALFPLFPLAAICMLKDPLFSLCCLTFSVLLFEIVRSKGESLKRGWFCCALFANALLVTLTKNQGVYVLAVTAIIYLIVYRQYWLQLIAAFLIPVLFFQFIWLKVLLPAWNVAPGGRQEVLGILFQQTARYVVTYPDDVTEEEADAIRAVIDYDHLAEKYNPTCSDSVKFTFNQDATNEELSAYYQAWFQMFLRHPGSYIQATINDCYGFFYFSYFSDLAYYDFNNRVEQGDEIYVKTNDLALKAAPILQQIMTMLQSIPVVSLFFNISVYVWAVLLFFLQSIRQKQYAFILSGMPSILSVGILLISPLNGNFRYVHPLLYAAPFLLSLCVLNARLEKVSPQKVAGYTEER